MKRGWFKTFLWGVCLGSGVVAAPLQAGTTLALKGFVSDNNIGLETQSSRSISASVGMDLGRFFGVSLTHRLAFNTRQYYEEQGPGTGRYLYKAEKIKNTSNSLDLSVILYPGELFVPYVMVGLIKKNYLIVSRVEDRQERVSRALAPQPNGGVGLDIRLSQRFSLKITHNVSPGVKLSTPDAKPTSALDSYSSVGVSYSL